MTSPAETEHPTASTGLGETAGPGADSSASVPAAAEPTSRSAASGIASESSPGSASGANAEKARVLCVDDEPRVLEGLTLSLGRRYQVTTATSGLDAIELIKKEPPYAVIISDMRMPVMDGAAFLKNARQITPDSVRVLLTGHSDVNAAIAAVNQGQIFRFLSKPCPPPDLLAAVEAGVHMNQLITAERVLLEQTLRGSIEALTEVLALTNPVSFGRANRLKRLVKSLAEKAGIKETWQLEVAAMFSQIGQITLPPETAERVHKGLSLSDSEQRMVARVPSITSQIIGRIPRLETVREILDYALKMEAGLRCTAPKNQFVADAAGILRVALDYDTLEARGNAPRVAAETMRRLAGSTYNGDTIQGLIGVLEEYEQETEVVSISSSDLRAGMLIAEDLYIISGMVLAPRGFMVTPSFVEKARNFRPGLVREPVRVTVPKRRPPVKITTI